MNKPAGILIKCVYAPDAGIEVNGNKPIHSFNIGKHGMVIIIYGLPCIGAKAVSEGKQHIENKQAFLKPVAIITPKVQANGKMPEHKHLDKQLECEKGYQCIPAQV